MYYLTKNCLFENYCPGIDVFTERAEGVTMVTVIITPTGAHILNLMAEYLYAVWISELRPTYGDANLPHHRSSMKLFQQMGTLIQNFSDGLCQKTSKIKELLEIQEKLKVNIGVR